MSASVRGWVNATFMPAPHTVLGTLYVMLAERAFLTDIMVSVYRIVVSFRPVLPGRSTVVCTEPFPYVVEPTTLARRWS